VFLSALLALFLGAMDSLIVSTAMPTIVADLGGLQLYSWVYSAYFLSRAVSLPIIGKLADLYHCRTLFLICIGVFIVASIVAATAGHMLVLIAARMVQGVGGGGIFALVYIVLADISSPADRARTLSVASAIWGVASVLGPTLGAFIVTYFSWRWIFWINVPLGLASFWGIGAYLVETRPRQGGVHLDFAGVAALTTAILAFLFVFLLGGRSYAWNALPIWGLSGLAVAAGLAFVFIEKRAPDPILSMDFFSVRGFSAGNGAVFTSSFVMFSMFAYAPLFIQGAQGHTPMQVGIAMITLSLGWSMGSLFSGRTVNRMGQKRAALLGAIGLLTGCGLTLRFGLYTTMMYYLVTFFLIGLGMGFISLSTLLVVQGSLESRYLGVATATQQFARTLGGTVGVGVCGSFITSRFAGLIDIVRRLGILDRLPAHLSESGSAQLESLMRPEVQSVLPTEVGRLMQETVIQGVMAVFGFLVGVAALCLVLCLLLPRGTQPGESRSV
jgi:EmrB/QacA subfamily drug resistance transporter